MGRQDQEQLKTWEVTGSLNKAFAMKTCLAPNEWQDGCRGGIIKAHTVSRSGSLKRIARNGHVYSVVRNLNPKDMSTGVPEPVLQGIRQASTFTGFCAKHDNDIFQPLEDQPFAGTLEQCFLVGYRALARELYAKRAAEKLLLRMTKADKGQEPLAQLAIQSYIQNTKTGTQIALRDLSLYKERYDSILRDKQFEGICGYAFEFSEPLPVMCSGAIFPVQDFDGVELQDLGNLSANLDQLCFSSLNGGERGVVVFSWLSEHDQTCQAFVKSVVAIPNHSVVKALLRFFFSFCENIHIAPEWWEGQSAQSRQALLNRTVLGIVMEQPPRLTYELDGDDELHAPLTLVKRYEITGMRDTRAANQVREYSLT